MYTFSSRTDIYKVRKSISIAITYHHHIWVMCGKMRFDVTESEFRQLLGYHITEFLTKVPDADLSLDDMVQLGLTASVIDSSRYQTFAAEEWNIETIDLDEDTGLYCGVDEETKRPHVILLYYLRIMGSRDSTEHVTKENEFHFSGRDQILAYIKIDEFCHEHPGRLLKVDFSRAREVNSLAHHFVLPTASPVRYRDISDSYMQAALCNALDILGYSDMAVHFWNYFRQVEMAFTGSGPSPVRVRDFGDLSKHLDPRRIILHPVRSVIPKLSYLLGLKSGICIVSVQGTNGIHHSFCVSAIGSQILDCIEARPLRLCAGAVRSCIGDGSAFVGVSEMRRVEVPLLRVKRRNRVRDTTKRRRKKAGAARDSASAIYRTSSSNGHAR